MISLVHLVTDLQGGGAETALVRLVSNLDRQKFRSTVISLMDGGPLEAELRAIDVPVITAGLTSAASAPFAFARVTAALRRLRPDVLQTWLFHADLAGLAAAAFVRVPVLCWNIRCAALSPEDHSRSLLFIRSTLARLSRIPDCIVVNSEEGQRVHERIGYHPRRWSQIPNGFDTVAFHPDAQKRADFRRTLGVDDDTPVVGLVARYHPMKDHHTFVAAAARVAASRPGARFVLAGKGVDRTNRALVDDLARSGLTGVTHLLGEVRDVAAVFSGIDVAVSASYSEGFPNTVGEAMACGVPCVVTDAGDSSHIVADTGRVVPVRDPERLAEAVCALIDMPARERQALGQRARSRIVSEFSMEANVRRYEELYQQLVEHR